MEYDIGEQRLYLHNWTLVLALAPEKIVYDTEEGNGSCDKDAVVHSVWCDMPGCWPKAEEDDNDKVDASKCVVDNAPDTWDVPRAPDQFSNSVFCGGGQGIVIR